MAPKVIKINTHIPVIPEWLKISKTVSFKIPLKTARELAKKLDNIQDDVDVVISFDTGKEVAVEVKFDSKDND